MPQRSVAYAVARIHVHEHNALDAARLERLLNAGSYADAVRTLSEIGWTGAEEGVDAEALAAEHVRQACALVKQVTPCPLATDSFFLRYDGLNIKSLLKARCLGQTPERLSECGVFPVDMLVHAVTDHTYKKLPDTFCVALDALERTLAVGPDALAIDATVDKAVFAQIQLNMRDVKSDIIHRYFTGRADLLNAIMLLRVKRMGRDAAFMASMLLPGGSIDEVAWRRAFEKPESIPAMLEIYGRRVLNAGEAAVQDGGRLPALEKAMDDALLAPFSRLKRDALRIEPVCGYILGAEREAAAVRLILAGKANGFAPESIRERLRELYGG